MTGRPTRVVDLDLQGQRHQVELVAPDQRRALWLLSRAPSGDPDLVEVFEWGGIAVAHTSDLDVEFVRQLPAEAIGQLIEAVIELLKTAVRTPSESPAEFKVEAGNEPVDPLDGIEINDDGTVNLEDMR